MTILGVTAPLSWNTGAAIVKDGKFLAAAEEERFNRIKHAPRIPPYKATAYCLEFARVDPATLDCIAVGYRSPLIAYGLSILENIKEANVHRLVREGGAFAEYYIGWVRYREYLQKLGVNFKKTRIFFIPHHVAHAASAYRCSGFSDANILTLDGQGEDDSGMLGFGTDGRIKKLQSIGHHQSLGWVYGDTTDILGFTPHSDEGKVMALVAMGKGTISLDNFFTMEETSYHMKHYWNRRFWQTLGPRRRLNEPLTKRHTIIARSVQHFVNDAACALARKLYGQTKCTRFVLAGGVALNCDMNSAIVRLPFVEDLFVQPAAYDAGCAIGAALEVSSRLGEPADFHMTHAYWGPEWSDKEIKMMLDQAKIPYIRTKNHQELVVYSVEALAKGKVLGWFQGRAEFGPRALGNRSILAHPGLSGMRDKINQTIKQRERWQPLAPSMLHEQGDGLFNDYSYSPFMLRTFSVKKEGRTFLSQAIHVDGTARLQSVTKKENPLYYQLLSGFYKRAGIPALLNTSFNGRGQPMVHSPQDALSVFFSTALDILALGSFIIRK